MSYQMVYDLLNATGETLYMVFFSTLFAVLLGLPLGILLYSSSRIKPNIKLNKILSALINIFRSIPFIILLVAIIPFTRLIVGTSIGINAAIVPLTIGATPFFARLVDNVLQSLPLGLIETGYSMGANTRQIILHIILPEAQSGLIHSITVTAITLINYSAMAGAVGAGGLGTLAINYGYQRFNAGIMIATVIVLIILVQLIQMVGDYLAKRCTHY
ncbi:TPA: methionine ABC transporter permease MetI [Legionella pneumophila subsp. pneumophila]|uniref:ABC transmembrane type-1 domain-containing protein n=1 Tax=Legionella pneumophila (strain Lens) TaxID=297245 RepID=Q5WVL7_LEGPL|nr:methionine ABC transporter permease [Legionella pneumophila]AOW51644.1 methionine ABC transporter permease [Legionella pneumophila subsp. pneumophila]AOW54762.1 methionine ABC transporter permease [Legionella pneumophila subsp. pneumophila]AOW56937.1 methionine ABC transporter permease [Legionella pneumophila subsp. pneumophila]AOW60135.1 methionine ABC transporter permease [Legionella pneumophila subsp. pneumophila]AOW65150.1 methionine ABC transporter permease [Legionella pneumophila subs